MTEIIKLNVEAMNSLLLKDNYEEVEKQVREIAKKYDGLVYNDVEIGEAKKIVAELNKRQKEANDLKIEIKKEVLKPVVEFEEKVKNLIAIIEEPKEKIKSQIDNYVERCKDVRRQLITNTFNSLKGDLPIDLNIIFNEKWLNSSESEKKVLEELDLIIKNIITDSETIKVIAKESEFEIQILDTFYKTCSVVNAINEKTRLEELKKQDLERKKKEQEEVKYLEKVLEVKENETINVKTGEIVEKEKEYTFNLSITATFNQKEKLKAFLNNNLITYKIGE